MNSTRPAKKSFPTSLVVLALAIGLTIIFILIPPHREEVKDQLLPWNSHFNTHNQLEALGLIVNQSTPNDAKTIFGDDVEVKLFSHKDESSKTAEVYFPSVHIGTIRGAIALSLDVNTDKLEEIYSQGIQTTVTQTGNRQVTPNTENIEFLLQRPIKQVTLLPKKHLTERAVKMRFGAPQRIEKQSDGLDHWFYPEKGLELIMDPEGPEALQYYPQVRK
ncbi:lytic murein transglycosylase [Hydrogenovibrio crunogenus]|uniref:Lytic murein transglycosylase n=1 Tax=Hydrogenovibrio crunogenus TaxID=39765 RepID=A0A4P7NWQ3_9GAMM|nr:hypothetical protein [Hydrogenovibrio crunogenus]QBZ82130.1 lytic murein transglycosylase [Hydrogenovibrio crunogenus]RUM93419.1 MAG: hypothetical protein DSZ27_00070 [Thiomicrospira sp.]